MERKSTKVFYFRFVHSVVLVLLVLGSCGVFREPPPPFDSFSQEVRLSPWHFRFKVENQNHVHGDTGAVEGGYYLKASVLISHSTSGESLLHAVSDDEASYSAKYHYLAFDAGGDLYLEADGDRVYALGYVFEPSLGLTGYDRLVYTFRLSAAEYADFRGRSEVSYWYIDRMAGLGRLCFTSNSATDAI